MSRKVAVIGDGHVGETVAHHLVVAGLVDKLVLFDLNEGKVKADAIDFKDAMANLPHHVEVTYNDYAELADTDIIVSALGNIKLQDNPDNDRFAELPYTSQQVKAVAKQIKAAGFHGKLVVITNPVDVITMLYQEGTGLPKEHVIGTGTLLDSARMKHAVAEVLDLDPRSVVGYNLGEHGNSQFTAWSTVRVLGKPITEIAAEKGLDLVDLDKKAREGGFEVFYGKKYTSYGIATAAVRLVETIFSDAHSELPVSNYVAEYGLYLSYPAIVGADGILSRVPLNLTDEELAKLQVSADYIKTKFEESNTK